jgi:hypothetical protein
MGIRFYELRENLQLATTKVFLFVFGGGDDEQYEVLGIDVIVDDTGAAPLAPAPFSPRGFSKETNKTRPNPFGSLSPNSCRL